MRKLLLAALLLFGCTKYEEGPWLAFSAKAERIAGDWQVKQAFDLDGNNYFLLFKGLTFSFEKEGGMSIRFDKFEPAETVAGTWEFRDQKEGLQWLLEADSIRLDSLLFPYDSLAVFDILRLDENDLRLIDEENRRIYLEH